ncbi:MAG TPA: MFS transporter [Acidimicrobiia bacterium]|nr:MFS transporter [Acidimicrobiia bacterium]
MAQPRKSGPKGNGANRRIRDQHHESVGAGDVDTIVETDEDVATGVSGTPLPGETPTAIVHDADQERSDKYLKSLFWLLIAATFFEGYDGAILSLVAPDIQDTFGVGESTFGVARGLIELGLFFAFFVARLGDRFGRRTLLLWSVFGYTVFTTLSAISWDLWSFTFFQSASRVFLGAEYAVAITMIVEEFPLTRRAGALGRLLLGAAAGALIVAVLLVLGIDQGPLEWRTLYLVGILPLLVLGWFRRRVKETRRFVEYQQTIEAGETVRQISFWEPWRPEFRGSLLLVGTVHLLRSLPLFASTSWFFFYAQREAGVDRELLFVMFIAAYGLGIGGYAFCGFLMERVGRRPTAIVYGIGSVVFPLALFQNREPALVALFLILGVFFGLGQAPLFGAMATELFPTYIRNAAAAWARNVFEIAGFIFGPLLAGTLGDHYSGAFGSVGDTVSFLFLLGIPGLWLLWRYLPETRGKELEDITVEVAGVASDLLLTDEDAVARARSNGRRTQSRVLLGVAAGIAVFGLIIVGLGAAGQAVRRPEGAAERFLRGVSDEDDELIDKYGSAELGAHLTTLAGWEREDDDEDWFEASEIGRAVPGAADAGEARIPFRIVRQDGADTQVFGYVVVVEQASDDDPKPWRSVAFEFDASIENTIVAKDAPDPPIAKLVPSGGGPEPTETSGSTWLYGVGGAIVLALLIEALLKAAGGVRKQAGQPVGGGA